MLNPEDRSAIEGLFDRLADVERNGPSRDAEADALIARKLVAQPGAAYFMAQTVLVQETALRLARERIDELEAEARRRPAGGGFLGGLFGDTTPRREPARAEQPVAQAQARRGPWDRQDEQRGGGGFLAGAAQTALGVTGGILLGQAIGSVFAAGAAQAAEPAPEPEPEPEVSDQDIGGDDFGGGDFDMGGDF